MAGKFGIYRFDMTHPLSNLIPRLITYKEEGEEAMPNDENGISMDYKTESSAQVVEETIFVSLDAAARISELEKLVREMGKGLDEIAKLGNGDVWGNSVGNIMAQKILLKPNVKAIMKEGE